MDTPAVISQPSLIQKILSYKLYIAIFVAIVVVAVLYMKRKKKVAEIKPEESKKEPEKIEEKITNVKPLNDEELSLVKNKLNNVEIYSQENHKLLNILLNEFNKYKQENTIKYNVDSDVDTQTKINQVRAKEAKHISKHDLTNSEMKEINELLDN